MQPTTYPNVSNIYATGAPSAVPSAAGMNGPDVSNIYADPNQAAGQPAAQQPKKQSGNWLTHLLPTIGSVAIPALGALLAPETGGLSLVAAAGLSGLGAAGGKAAENAVEGKGVGDDVLTSGVEGAAGGAVGGVAGKVLGKGAELLANRAGKITTDAAEAAAQKTAQNSDLATANAIRNNYGSISEKLQSDSHLALGSNQKMLKELGYDHTDPYQMAKAAEAGYHPTDLSLNGIYDEALQGAKPIQTSEINPLFGASTNTTLPGLSKQEMAMLGKAGITPEVAAKGTVTGAGAPVNTASGLGSVDPVSPMGKVLSDFSERTKGIYGKGEGLSLPESVPATDIRKLQQAVGKEMRTQQTLINNAANNGVSNVEAESAHNALGKVYDNLGGRIKTPEVDASIASRVTSPEERAALVEKFGETHGNHVADTIDNAQGANDILGPMKNYTQMGQASDMAINDIENVTAGTRAVARTKADVNGDGIADNVPPVPTAGDALTAAAGNGIHGGPTAMIAKALYQSKDNPAILKTLSRIGALGEKLAPSAGAAIGASNAQLQSNGDTMGGMMPPQQTDPTLAANSTVPQGGLTRNDLITLALYSPSAFNSLVTPSAANQQNVATANTAEQALSSLGPAPTGGIVSQLAGKFGLGATGEYQRKASAAAQQVAAALPGADAGAIEKQLTNYMAGGASIDEAVQQLMQSLHATAQNNTNGSYQQLMNFNPSQPQSVVSAAGL